MAASVSSCPVEILHMIAAAADPIDLANIRLVSKQWCAVSSKFFGVAKLRHPRFVMSPYSLQGLLDLTAHPILGACVQSVNIGSYRLEKHLVNTQPHLHQNRANAAALTQFRFEQTGLHLSLLAQAFVNLRRHGVASTLGVFEDVIRFAPGSEVHSHGYGYDELYGSIDVIRCGKTQTTLTLAGLIRASIDSQCPLSGISIDLKWIPSAREAVTQSPGLYALLRDLSITKHGRMKSGINLTVTLTSGKHKINDKHNLEIRDQGKHLRLIRISIEDYQGSTFPQLEPEIFGPLVDACYHGQFQQITLTVCDIDKSIFRLLRAHAKSLRHLTLSSISFHDDGPEDAVNLFLVLRDDVALQKISLNNIVFHNRRNEFTILGEDLEYHEWRGSEQIVTLLDNSIKWVQTANINLERFRDDDGDDDHDYDDYDDYDGYDDYDDYDDNQQPYDSQSL